MNRREFVGGGLLALAGTRNLKFAQASPISKKLHIPYMRESAPDFEIPPYRGERYEDTVPDTLDLAERLRLAVHASTSIADPDADDEVFWQVDFLRDPPAMAHDFNDWVLQLEGLLEGVPLGRTATGSSENDHVDHTWTANWVLRSIGPDGLLYVPMGGRPWGRMSVLMPGQRAFRRDGSAVRIDDPSVSQIASAYTCQRVIPLMTLCFVRDQNPMWTAAIEKMIGRLSQLAIQKEDYAYWPDGVL